eukprot:g3739.t1
MSKIKNVPFCVDNRTVGILGGGQLGRMCAYAAHRLGLRMVVLDPKGESSPAGQASAASIAGSFKEACSVRELGKICDVLTVEIEHIDTQALEELESEGKDVQPKPSTLRMIQDKYLQKVHMKKAGVPLGDFASVSTKSELQEIAQKFGGFPVMLKSRLGAYDGKGNAVCRSLEDVDSAWQKLGGDEGNGLYVERWVPFAKELAVMVARGKDGEMKTYPVVETIQKDNVCHTVIAPAEISAEAYVRASEVASQAIASVEGRGIFGVELFLLDGADCKVYLNEIAPRPHNSGHYTIEACHTCQFENHLRAVLGLPLGDPSLKVGAAKMINVLGHGSSDADLSDALHECRAGLGVPGAGIHWYGKEGCRGGRKMAHVTVVAPDRDVLEKRCSLLREAQQQKE